MTGLAIQAISRYGHYRRYAHLGYHLQSTPPSLGPPELFWKVAQFVAFDKTLYDLTGYSTLGESPEGYIGYCLRAAVVREIV